VPGLLDKLHFRDAILADRRRNVKTPIVPLLSILLVCMCATLLSAQIPEGDITVETEGYGLSRSDALLKAKRNAVEKGIGTVLISQTEVRNFQLQKDIVLTKTAGSVTKYDVFHEEKRQDGTFYVKLRAVVSLASIKEDLVALKILLESMDKPRIMVVIREENGHNAESAILDYLTEKEFELVDAAVVAVLMQKDDHIIRRAAEGDPLAAARIGASNGAEYVIVGKVTKSLATSALLSGSGMKSGQANITAKVVNCSNAKIIASKSANGAAVHISGDVAKAKAAEQAAKKLMGRKLFEEIVSSFQDMINNGIPLDVTVKNVANFGMQKAVREVLGELSDVVSVNKRSFGGGQLELSLLYKGNADSFSEAVDGKTVGEKKLSVTDVAGSRVVIQLE
jgi:hypothetical protein